MPISPSGLVVYRPQPPQLISPDANAIEILSNTRIDNFWWRLR
jgi:hypothetical protein